MLRNVFLKTLRDQSKSGLFWVAGLLAISAYVMFLYPVIADQSGLNEFIQALPEAIKALVGGVLDYSTAIGFLSAQMFSLMAPLILIVYASLQGVGAIAGEEERGTLSLLLACPVSRRAVLIQKAAALAIGIAVGSFALWAGLLVWAAASDTDLPAGKLANGCVSLFMLALFFGMLALVVGAATGRKGLSGATAGAFAVASYLLNSFIPLVDWLAPARFVSPFYYYQGNNPLNAGLSAAHLLALGGVSILLIVYGVWAFERRDLVK